MITAEMVISFVIGALITIIYKVVKPRREESERRDVYLKSSEVSQLIFDVMDFGSIRDKAKSLRKVQEDALQKIKAICGHQGVQVKIGDGHYDPIITPSINIIKSLGFMKEYLPEIEEIWQIYKDNDAVSYVSPFYRKQSLIYSQIMSGPSSSWKLLTDEQKKKIIQDLSDEYDRNHPNK